MSNKYYFIVLLITFCVIIRTFGQDCKLDTTELNTKRFYPDFPMNDPVEGYVYRFDTLSDGNWKQYRESQSDVYKVWHISMGKLQGPMVYFNKWGEKTAIECYVDGQLISITSYHSNGNISEQRKFNKENKIISRKSWYSNGVLMLDASNKIHRRWSDNGYLLYRKRFENDLLIHVELYIESHLYYQGFWKEGSPIGGRHFIYKKNDSKQIRYNSLKDELKRIIESNDLIK